MINDTPSICIVIPYFGKWPFWINFFIESCRFNPTINWLIYTDCGGVDHCPKNVTIKSMTYQDYCELVSAKLNIIFKPINPYKLCDIRPAYGLIHREELANYNFWGFGDIDLIYGDIRHFLTNERLALYDVFSNHSTRTSGHLCLIRNLADLRLAYKKIPNWQHKFTTQQHLAIDEKDFSKLFLRHKNSPQIIKKIAVIIDPWLKRAEFIEAYSTPNARIAWVDGSYNFPKKWIWENGHLSNDINNNIEFMYFHFYSWKKQWVQQDKIIFAPLRKQSFKITASGFN